MTIVLTFLRLRHYHECMGVKTTQLQIRVNPWQKADLKARAKRAKMGMSEWILTKIFPPQGLEWQKILKDLSRTDAPRLVIADVNDFLTRLSALEFAAAVGSPDVVLDVYWANYVAAMVEYAAHKKNIVCPAWVMQITPLPQPVFGTSLKSVRLHLLTESPPPFRNRNIFIDTTVGGRV